MLRRARDLLARATRGAVRFPRPVITLFTEAIHWRNGYAPGVWTDDQLDGLRSRFDDRLLELVTRPRAVPGDAAMAKHLWNHFEPWFAFVFDPRIEPTNWKAEQAIRPAVVNRKVWGGNRTAAGAQAQGVLMSVFETCRRQTRWPTRSTGCGSIRPPRGAGLGPPCSPMPKAGSRPRATGGPG
jgi:transposase